MKRCGGGPWTERVHFDAFFKRVDERRVLIKTTAESKKQCGWSCATTFRLAHHPDRGRTETGSPRQESTDETEGGRIWYVVLRDSSERMKLQANNLWTVDEKNIHYRTIYVLSLIHI